MRLVVAPTPARTVQNMLHARLRPLRLRARRGTTVVELVALLAVLAVLAGAAATRVIPTQNDVLDQAGAILAAGAVTDARAVASATHYRYGETQVVTDQLNALVATRTTPGLAATYTTQPSQPLAGDAEHGTATISTTVVNPTTVAFAVMTTRGSGQEAHCWFAVDSLRNGTQYVRMDDAMYANVNACTGSVAATCTSALDNSPAMGTVADPHQMSASERCVRDAVG